MTALFVLALLACISLHTALITRIWQRLSVKQRCLVLGFPGSAFLYAMLLGERRLAGLWVLSLCAFSALLVAR
jgi:hypothetical protein